MRLLDAYAINCGAKIDKPFIYEQYFPIPTDKFITFQAQTRNEARDYDYWQDVINIISPILKNNNIHILQVGEPTDNLLKQVIDIRGKTNIHQLAYLIKRAVLHLGPDSLDIHLASFFNTPIVGLYSSNHLKVSGPHFGSPEKQVLFGAYERIRNKKPSFDLEENPKSINTIKPEEIAAAVFKLLGINFVIPFETVFLGEKYCSKTIREIIPNANTFISNPEAPVEIRVDLHYDKEILTNQLNYLQKAVIIADKPIDLGLLKHFKDRIPIFVYRITENDDPSFVEKVIGLGIQVALVSTLSLEELKPKRIKYYEFGRINLLQKPPQETIDALKKDINKLYYRSMKFVTSNKKVYDSHAAIEIDRELVNDHEYNKVVDSPKFWEDLNFCIVVKLIE